MLQPDPESAKEPTPEARALVNSLEPKAERKVKTDTRGRHGRYTEEEVQTMADRYEGGEDAATIAKDYGCSRATVYNLMSRRGISKQKQKNTKPTPKIDVGKVWALHDAGWTPTQITEEFFAAKATITQIKEILKQPRPVKEKEPEEEDEE